MSEKVAQSHYNLAIDNKVPSTDILTPQCLAESEIITSVFVLS